MNQSLFTKPSKMTRAMMPSEDSADNTEYHCPQMNVTLLTHGLLRPAHPFKHWFVLSSTLDSSSQTKYSTGMSPYSACHVALRSSFLSAAVFDTALWLSKILFRVHESVEMDTLTFQACKSCSWSSSRYTVTAKSFAHLPFWAITVTQSFLTQQLHHFINSFGGAEMYVK